MRADAAHHAPTRRRAAVRLAAATAALVAACGSASPATTRSATPSPSATLRATPESTPSPSAGRDSVEITMTGLGAYLETAVPVVIVHNLSLVHVVRGVSVHFRVLTPSGADAGDADTAVAQLLPDQTAAITARIAASASGDRVEAQVSAGEFVAAPSPAPAEHVDGVGVRCPRCGSRGGSGDARGTLTLTASGGSSRSLQAACTDASGAIVGGGSAVVSAGGDPTMLVDVPVILSVPARTCRIDSFPGGF